MVYVDEAAVMVEFFKIIPVIFISIAFVFALFWFLHFIEEALNPKSKRYRTLLKDMYVVAVIKQKAKEKGIDLLEELKEFTRIVKKSELRRRDLDNIVESELNEEIVDEFERDRETKSKKKEEKK